MRLKIGSWTHCLCGTRFKVKAEQHESICSDKCGEKFKKLNAKILRLFDKGYSMEQIKGMVD
jgi:predicted nucleic acid-binding Zn ribbon protein